MTAKALIENAGGVEDDDKIRVIGAEAGFRASRELALPVAAPRHISGIVELDDPRGQRIGNVPGACAKAGAAASQRHSASNACIETLSIVLRFYPRL